MYDSNNYNYSNGSFTPVESEEKPAKKSGGAGKAIAAILAVVLIGGASGYGGAYLANMNNETVSVSADATTAETQRPVVTASTEQASTAEALNNKPKPAGSVLTTAEVINKVTPSVVHITSEFDDMNSGATGTGIIFTADGYIVTNAHVISAEQQIRTNNNDTYPSFGNDPFSSFFENFYNFGGGNYETVVVDAEKVTVTMSDGTEYEAEVIGSDSNTDLAVLKIEAENLTAAEIGDSKALVMGDTAITLGYPLGLGLSASDGIISGLDKEMSVEVAGGSVTMNLLQTDAAINSGNSGGPLLNSRGQVVGITSSKLTGSSIDGVGFAIPITDALPIINELMTTGEVKNTIPKIGITGMEITQSVQRYYGLPIESGVFVESVEPGSCAEKAGIAAGDVIVAADGEEVTDMDTLIKLKNKHKAGEKMIITLARNDGNIDVELILDVDE